MALIDSLCQRAGTMYPASKTIFLGHLTAKPIPETTKWTPVPVDTANYMKATAQRVQSKPYTSLVS